MAEPPEPKSYGDNQWIQMEITNRMRKSDIHVKNAYINYGKFYKDVKDKEISADEVNRTSIAPGAMAKVNACGRYMSPSGTDGSIDLYEGDTKICKLSWNCPYGSSSNSFGLSDYDVGTSDYSVNVSDWGVGPGPIGRVSITVARLA
ncbi:hypothetical protein CDD81_7363 [Ophiocordyceps australis]|uniref:Asp-hemolysin n=1 Tax=Ophiocordyceps australis TaxID=1399860 RepID=A0A2C5X903_9HYPO|nr:hypothetical protein CDD81_7363 [Ophiocordyceps australis]